MDEQLSKAEIRKDALQGGVEAMAQTVGRVATILTTAVGDIAQAVGGFATEMFEIRDAARRASGDQGLDESARAPGLDDPTDGALTAE